MDIYLPAGFKMCRGIAELSNTCLERYDAHIGIQNLLDFII